MRFIREMIARKAAGEDQYEDTDSELSEADTEVATSTPDGTTPIVDEGVEAHANSSDAPGWIQSVEEPEDDSYDEDAELEALDATLPAFEEVAEPEIQHEPSAGAEDDTALADDGDDDPLPTLSAEDIERAMKLRKRIWHSLPEDDLDFMSRRPEEDNMVTRPIRRLARESAQAPASTPLHVVHSSDEIEREMEAQAAEEQFDEGETAEETASFEQEVPAREEAASFEVEEQALAAEEVIEQPEASDEEDWVAESDQTLEAVEDAISEVEPEPTMEVAEEAASLAPDASEAFDEPVEEFEEVAERGELQSDDLLVLGGAEAAEAPEPSFVDEAHGIEEPAVVLQEQDEPAPAPLTEAAGEVNIQALMARAALEAAQSIQASNEEPVMEAAPAAFEDEDELASSGAPRGRRGGRVKTRLLGFQPDDGPEDVFGSVAARAEGGALEAFPVGWMVVTAGPGRGSAFSLHNGVSLIGRGEDQAVRLNFGDTSISRNNHASVAFDDESNAFYLGHGGKSNIVRLNGKPVLSTEELKHGDSIRIGETTLRFAALCGSDFTWAEDSGDGADDAATA